jgi:molecular chaperone HtpG
LFYTQQYDKILHFRRIKENLAANQTDKDGKLLILYAGNKEAQHSYIETAKKKGYEVFVARLSISH